MSDLGTKRMLDLYVEEASSPMFLSRRFRTPPQNFHRSKFVTADVIRHKPEIAVPIPDVSSGARLVESTKAVNKEYTPIAIDEETPLSVWSALDRKPGRDPFEDPDFIADAADEAFRHMRYLEDRTRRTVELACAQVLQTGAISLVDASGNVIYAIDYEAKATHITTVNVTWATNGGAGTPLADLGALADVIRRDGQTSPDILIFGRSALQRFLANTDVKAQLDNKGMDVGHIAPSVAGEGATLVGWIWIGLYRFEIWGYQGEYVHPQTGTMTPYVDDEKVIMMSSKGRLDLTFGAWPRIVPNDARAANFLPSRISSSSRGLDITTNAWITPNNKQLMLGVASRPLPIPTAIDSFGCLDVTT